MLISLSSSKIMAETICDTENFCIFVLGSKIHEGFVTMLYPDKPKHPRQKYLLTVKGIAMLTK